MGRPRMCNEQSVKNVRRKARRTHYVERIRECERVFEPHRTRRYGRLSRPRTLFASLGTAALSHTHRSRRGLHGVEAAFTLSSPPFSCQAPSSFFLAPITTFAILTS